MKVLDDRIGISHMISCFCGSNFISFNDWITHKLETNHIFRKSHIVAIIVGSNEQVLSFIERK